MAKKKMNELADVAGKINEMALDLIGEYQKKKYGTSLKPESYQTQMDEFYNIVEQVSAFLMGNALALMDEDIVDEEIDHHCDLLRNVTSFIRKEMQEGILEDPRKSSLPN